MVLLLAGCKAGPAPAPEGAEAEGASGPVSVVCVEARAGTASDALTFRGRVVAPAERDAQLAPSAAGRIVAVAVAEGAVVHRGDLLARVEDPSLAEGIAEADADAASAQAANEAARTALQRAERLAAEGVVSKRDLEDTREHALTAQATLRAAQARQRLAAARSARSRLDAPFDGTVIHLLRRTGELVDGTPATPILELADLSALELVGDVPAAQLVRVIVDADAPATIDAFGTDVFPGKVAAVSPTVDPATALGLVRIRLDPEPRLRMGMAGKAAVSIAQRTGATLLPASALRRSPEGEDQAIVCEGKGATAKAAVRAVTLGAHMGDEVEVTEGVKPGERVVARDLLALDDGATLSVEAEGAAGADPAKDAKDAKDDDDKAEKAERAAP